jgi:hypothetical protein
MRDEAGRVLCPSDGVLEARAGLLEKLGAVELGVALNEDAKAARKELNELAAKLATAEEKIRLIAAARASARERELSALAEEKAYMEIAILGLDPLG